MPVAIHIFCEIFSLFFVDNFISNLVERVKQSQTCPFRGNLMKTKLKAVLFSLLFILMLVLGIYYVVSHEVTVLYPKGMIGIKERDIILTASILMMIVVVPVFVLTLFFAWKYRESNEKARHEPEWEHNNIAEVCWWGVPLVIIVILGVITWKSSHALNPFKPIENGKTPIEVQVVALDWKWLFI